MKERKACTRGVCVCLHPFLSVYLGPHPGAGGQRAPGSSGLRSLVPSVQGCLFPTSLKLRFAVSGARLFPHGSCWCLRFQMRRGLSVCLF